MPLPGFDIRGDLPVGVHQATLTEVLNRFGHGTPQRELVTTRLVRVYELAQRTGKLLRFIIFGSYVTTKPEPNDVDIILTHWQRKRDQSWHGIVEVILEVQP